MSGESERQAAEFDAIAHRLSRKRETLAAAVSRTRGLRFRRPSMLPPKNELAALSDGVTSPRRRRSPRREALNLHMSSRR